MEKIYCIHEELEIVFVAGWFIPNTADMDSACYSIQASSFADVLHSRFTEQ